MSASAPHASRPLPEDVAVSRPFWSVMIPTYNPPAHYLEETLRSVLAQDPGPNQMHIEVVDDCSPNVDVAALVKAIAGERVKVFRSPVNKGLAGCWNTCVERARGEWVHILHQDDVIFPGFYNKLREGILAEPSVGAAFCRTAHIDDQSRRGDLTPAVCETAGIAGSLVERLACWQLIQFASIVIRREVHQAVGPFDEQFKFVIDWEMWLRIARQYPVWHEPAVLAGYRLHGLTETSRLKLRGDDIREVRDYFARSRPLMTSAAGRAAHAGARRWYALRAVDLGVIFFHQRRFTGAWNQIVGGVRLSPTPAIFLRLCRFFAEALVAGLRKLSGSNARQKHLKQI